MSPARSARADDKAQAPHSSADGAHDDALNGSRNASVGSRSGADASPRASFDPLDGERGDECLASCAFLAITRKPSAGVDLDGHTRGRDSWGGTTSTPLRRAARPSAPRRPPRAAKPSGMHRCRGWVRLLFQKSRSKRS